MFDRFVKFAEVRLAIRRGELRRAIQLLEDGSTAPDRKARAMTVKVCEALEERVRQRLGKGQLNAAERDLELLRRIGAETSSTDDLTARLDELRCERESAEKSRAQLLEAIDRAVTSGELANARVLLAELPSGDDEAARCRDRLARRAESAASLTEQSRAKLNAGDVVGAADDLSKARDLDHGVSSASLAEAIGGAAARSLRHGVERVVKSKSAPDVLCELESWVRVGACLSGDGYEAATRDARDSAERFLVSTIIGHLEAGRFDEAVSLIASLRTVARRRGPFDAYAGGAVTVERARSLEQKGDFDGAIALLRDVGPPWSGDGVARWIARLAEDARCVEGKLSEARQLLSNGEVLGARKLFGEIVRCWPAHEGAKTELLGLDDFREDRERRLSQARSLIREGRLRGATAGLVGLVVPGPDGEEPRVLLDEIRARVTAVEQSLQSVLRQLHGSATSSAGGLRSCLEQLESLHKQCIDHEEVAHWIRQVRGEIALLEIVSDLTGHLTEPDLSRMSLVSVSAAARDLEEVVDELPQPDRVRSSLESVLDKVMSAVDRLLASGRSQAGSKLCALFRDLAAKASRETFVREFDRREKRASEMVARASDNLRNAHIALEERRIEDAETLAARASEDAADNSNVRRIEAELRRARQREVQLADLSSMTNDAEGTDDADEAASALGALGPTPALLRTRVFDLKRDIARSQGLQQPFLLRVDEGGEYLVTRQDSVSIGNVRDGRSDLPMLANLAGLHARFRRSMSFHGGMTDTIHAESGVVFVNGARVEQHALCDGEEVRLGRSVSFRYQVPSRRSLSSLLRWGSGFQVAGTDSLILMKDRGRDGRLLIGPGSDCHVRVVRATAEVELFADRNGQMRVAVRGQGTLDGKPFSGEHPVAAGVFVECGGVSFVLQPWRSSPGEV